MTQGAIPYRVFEGPGGATVEVYDLTSAYAYQNIFWVKLKIVGRFPGFEQTFERVIERMGVFEEDLERVREEMLASFRETGLAYLFRPDFAKKLSEAQKAKPPVAGGYGNTP